MSRAGGSAAREYQRRKEARRRRFRANLVRILGAAVMLGAIAGLAVARAIDPRVGWWVGLLVVGAFVAGNWVLPQSTTAWAIGAAGERRTARALAKLPPDRFAVLHDRAIPGSRANIDHIVIGPPGVFVVESKFYKGKVTLKGDQLLVNGRRKPIIEQAHREAAAVQSALRPELSRLGIDVWPFVCIHGADLPRTRKVLGVRIVGGRGLVRALMRMPTVLRPESVRLLEGLLIQRLPSAG
jgi:hypothetical protein